MSVIYKGYSSADFDDWETRLSDRDLVIRDLLNAILTSRGERVMLPRFGTTLRHRLFTVWNEDDRVVVRNEISEMIAADPRVEAKMIDVRQDGHTVTIQMILQYVELDLTEELLIKFTAGEFGLIEQEINNSIVGVV